MDSLFRERGIISLMVFSSAVRHIGVSKDEYHETVGV